jgi:hypothetical protein
MYIKTTIAASEEFMYYKVCARCKFRVPVRLKLCQVCGNRRWLINCEGSKVQCNEPTTKKPLAGTVKDFRPEEVTVLRQMPKGDDIATSLGASAAPLGSEEEIVVLKHEIEELSNWFRNYGNDGLLKTRNSA